MYALVVRRVGRVVLSLHRQGLHALAHELDRRCDEIASGCVQHDRYERLELDDIIKGHERAWHK